MKSNQMKKGGTSNDIISTAMLRSRLMMSGVPGWLVWWVFHGIHGPGVPCMATTTRTLFDIGMLGRACMQCSGWAYSTTLNACSNQHAVIKGSHLYVVTTMYL